MTVAEVVGVLPRRMSGWAAQAPLGPNSLTGISVSLGVCAVVWFTAGTRWGNLIGAVALGGSYLAGRSARGLQDREPGAAAAPAATARATPSGSAAWPAREMVVSPLGAAVSASRLASVCAVVTECGVCAGLAAGGLAAGGPAAGRIGMWQLATTAVVLLAVSQLAVACGRRPFAGGRPPAGRWRKAARYGVTWRTLAFPYGGQVLLIAVAAPALGARAALFGLLGGAVIAIGYAVVTGRPRRAGDTGVRPVAACRDDGPVASALGRPVRGQLVPLPPALTGLAAVCVLAVLGLRDLPGFLLFAPVVAMLLAAVGSSHPHDGRLDWIVPVVLQAGQYVYIAALGFATGVPAPVIFALCALITVHYADLAGHAQQRTALGWDGRMIAVGLGAALGIATFAYLLLAAYLVVLICRELTSWPAATEGDRR
jgi:Family of unknown function (DUF5941)